MTIASGSTSILSFTKRSLWIVTLTPQCHDYMTARWKNNFHFCYNFNESEMTWNIVYPSFHFLFIHRPFQVKVYLLWTTLAKNIFVESNLFLNYNFTDCIMEADSIKKFCMKILMNKTKLLMVEILFVNRMVMSLEINVIFTGSKSVAQIIRGRKLFAITTIYRIRIHYLLKCVVRSFHQKIVKKLFCDCNLSDIYYYISVAILSKNE